jgi:hypothetical protein
VQQCPFKLPGTAAAQDFMIVVPRRVGSAPTHVLMLFMAHRTTAHQRKSFCVKRLVGASSVVWPCIEQSGSWSQQRVIGLERRRAGLPKMSDKVTGEVPQCRVGLAPTARL